MRKFLLPILLCVAILTTACQNAPRNATEAPNPTLGNGGETVTVSPKPTGEASTSGSPEPTAPVSRVTVYASPADIPEGGYAIKHHTEDGDAYYAPFRTWGGYTYEEQREIIKDTDVYSNVRYGCYSADYTRFVWEIDGVDEDKIPTMHAGDTIVFHSKDAIPQYFAVERFGDLGYTIGVAQLVESASGNYMYSLATSFVEPEADTVNLENLGATDIYLVSVGGLRITSENVSKAGTIMGLEKGQNYACDVRTGTESIMASFKATTHVWYSMEQFMTAKFDFIDAVTIEIPLDSTLPSGYYTVNGCGLFKYIAEEDFEREEEMTVEDFNKPFFAYDENGWVISTVEGYYIDDDGFVTTEKLDSRDDLGD